MAKSNKKSGPKKKDTANCRGQEAVSNNITECGANRLFSKSYIDKQRDAIFSIFDMHIEHLKQMMTSGTRQDYEKIKKAQKVIKSIDDDVQKIARRIEKQNRKDQSLSQGFKGITESKGIKEKALATLDLSSLVLDKIPGVGYAKSRLLHVVRGKLQLHYELGRQYRAATRLKDQLKTLLYGEDGGLISFRDSLLEEIGKYGNELETLKREGEGKLTEIQERKNKREPLVKKLIEEYAVEEFEKLNPGELSSDNLVRYNEVTSIETKIMQLEQELKEKDERCKIVGNYIQGKRTALGIYIAYFMQGERIYKQVDGFLEASQSDINGSAKISQFESIMTAIATTVHNLVENYNDILEAHSKHTVKLAENSEYIVPDTLHKPETMIKTVQNVKKAIGIYFEKDPIGAAKQIAAVRSGTEKFLPSKNYQNTALIGGNEKPSDDLNANE